MISLDMKYTSLYWALRFVENELDIHTKVYDGYSITIYAEEQRVDYGNLIKSNYNSLVRHKDFVILECVDRLLTKGYLPSQISINNINELPDIRVENLAIKCEQWVKDYDQYVKTFTEFNSNVISILYTSRLVSGLLEYKNIILKNAVTYNYGIFEDGIEQSNYKLSKAKETKIIENDDFSDFFINEDELVQYTGKSRIVIVPEGIKTVAACAFWNCTSIEEIILPESLEKLGGDAFYYCTNLRKVNIPKNVWIMGNNPFAGCPYIKIDNNSKNFILENDILYNKDKSTIIHYPIDKTEKVFIVPDNITCLGKHSFFNCNSLEIIVIPNSVIKFENNPFSGCEKLNLINHSPNYVIENGVIYNKFLTTIIGCLNNAQIDEFIVPESVTLISRNSFWNCRNIKKIVLTKNIRVIGYNPFASCINLIIESQNPKYKVRNGLLLNEMETELICCTNVVAKNGIVIPDSVRIINRGAFSGCVDLQHITLNKVTYMDKSSFTNCIGLTKVYLPDTIEYIGEWAFSYCLNLLEISINEKTIIDKNAFNECPVKVIRRC